MPTTYDGHNVRYVRLYALRYCVLPVHVFDVAVLHTHLRQVKLVHGHVRQNLKVLIEY